MKIFSKFYWKSMNPVFQSEMMMITAVPVKQQAGNTECGLFAIAFTYHAAI